MRYIVLACVIALAGCDRAPLAPAGTQLLVADPDLGVVQLEPSLTLRLLPPEFSGPLAVRVDGREVPFDSTQGAFVLDVELARGLNRLAVEVIDDTDQTDLDTLYAVYLPLQPVALPGFANAPAQADAAVAPLAVGSAVVAGGSGASGQALNDAVLIRSGGSQVSQSAFSIAQARTGHTATNVGGSVLLLGGTTSDTPASAADFVGPGEWIAPGDLSRSVEVEGDIRRTRHTTRALTLDGVTYLYLYGGVVPSGNGLTRSGTVDVLEFQPAGNRPRLIRLSPSSGAGGFTVMSDHLQLTTGATSSTILGLAQSDPISFVFDWSLPGTASFPFSLRSSPAGAGATPRTRAASVDLGGGLALVSGGLDADGETLGSLEVYSTQADRGFLVPMSIRLQIPRYDHIATILPNGRIVIGGGRSSASRPLSSYESFQF